MLCEDGCVYKMDTGVYNHEWSFETDLITNKTVNIKHIKKLQMLVELAESANMQVYILYDDEEFDKDKSHLVYTNKKHGRIQKTTDFKISKREADRWFFVFI